MRKSGAWGSISKWSSEFWKCWLRLQISLNLGSLPEGPPKMEKWRRVLRTMWRIPLHRIMTYSFAFRLQLRDLTPQMWSININWKWGNMVPENLYSNAYQNFENVHRNYRFRWTLELCPKGAPRWRAGGECFAPCNERMISRNVHLKILRPVNDLQDKCVIWYLKKMCSKSWGTMISIRMSK